MMLTREVRDALESVNPEYLGYGEFSPMTKFLLTEDYITIEIVEEKYWKATLTAVGSQALTTE